MRKREIRLCTVALALLLAFAAVPATAQEVVGSLSNFDVRNNDRRTFNDFELMLFGRVSRECIESFYPGWGSEPKVSEGTPFGRGVTITWANSRDPIQPGRTEHFGVRMSCEGPITARGFWSIDGRPVREVPLPWQVWRAGAEAILDVVELPEDLDIQRVRIQRQWVTIPEPIDLEELNWDEVEERVIRFRRRWRGQDDEILGPGDSAPLKIPVTLADKAVLVRYVVESEQGLVARFINEAILSWGLLCPLNLPDPQIQITGSEDYEAGGNAWTRYNISVTNRASYPNALFAPAPDLPPCGLNANSSRTWVDIHDGDGNRLYGFCALGQSENLNNLWFAVPRGTPPPDCVSVTLKDRRCQQEYSSTCAPITGLGPACIDFESLPLNTNYNVGDTFSDSGANMTVEPFEWSNSNWTNAGHARVTNAGMAGGSGQDLNTNNVNVDVDFPVTPNVVHLNFGEYGGNLNIEVNGDFQNFGNFVDIHNTVIGGATATVTNGLGNDQGTLLLSGEINSLSLGGQELWVDDICYTEQPGVIADGTWILPYGVGGTPLYRIQPNGLTNYGGITNAPFGGHLGFRLGRANVIPTNTLYYYRFEYKHESESDFTDFNQTVRVHYQVESAGNPPVFPTIELGPKSVGTMKLYRFRPHQAELTPPLIPPLAAGETASWPSTGWIGDIYRGFLNTVGLSLNPGRYTIRLTIYNNAGVQVTQQSGAFKFVEPISHDPDGTLHTANVPNGDLVNHGFEFDLHIDNRPTGALIDEPMIGALGAGDCGFLRYNPATLGDVSMSFWATHPANFAIFNFGIRRGPNNVTTPGVSVSGVEVSAPSAGVYTGNGFGHFTKSDFKFAELLQDCGTEAAFAAHLYVKAKATRGWGTRISSLDRSFIYAFALTPNSP
ncbi:MAG: hypothetical protein ACE5GX_10220 [Thermoanaerobaculia bacterium]